MDIGDFTDPKTIELFETVVEMFCFPCDVDFERDHVVEQPPIEPDKEPSVIGSPLDYYVLRCTYSASQTQVRTNARARTHTQRTHARACTRVHARVQHGHFEGQYAAGFDNRGKLYK